VLLKDVRPEYLVAATDDLICGCLKGFISNLGFSSCTYETFLPAGVSFIHHMFGMDIYNLVSSLNT
jgi:hypothetical protein